ncbi:MAG: putative sensor domain DACNV-containing protein [Desulfobulbaceae bacterium]
METPAFHLHEQFIAELSERINTPGEAGTLLTGISTDLRPGEIPAKEHLALLLDAVFWASHEKEEGVSVTVSLIYRQPEQLPDSFCFDRPLALHSRNLVKLGPALENPRAHISIWPDERGELKIWGFKTGSDDFITTDLWVQALGPGCVLISYGGRGLAALTGNRAVFVDPGILMKAIMPKIAPKGRPGELNLPGILRYNSLLYIAQTMRAHGHGGTVLAVPEKSDWRKSIRLPVTYTGGASFLDGNIDLPQADAGILGGQKSIFEMIKNVFTRRQDKYAHVRNHIREQCNRIARLTAVDGALIMSFDRYTYCFGAKIQQIEALPATMDLRICRPVEGSCDTNLNISDLGGTRHQSAAQFAYEQPQSIAIVASQDGDVTFFTRMENGTLLAVQQAELALLHEGLSGALWNISLFSRLMPS